MVSSQHLEDVDLELLRSDINPKFIGFVDNYYVNEYIHDFSSILINLKEDAYICEFKWDRYNLLEPIITRKFNSFIGK